ncbi:uncharacterized protein METZ01_LOCUS415874, partial [marine metagenome]
MLEPKKTKFRRHHRGNTRGTAKGGEYYSPPLAVPLVFP